MKAICILFIINSIQLSGQSLSGKIINSYTNQPVVYATIYVNKSTNGTLSNNEGVFTLTGITYPCEIVMSHVSYNTVLLTLDQKSGSDLLINATPKVIEIGEITIVDENLRKKNIQRFKDGLLGIDKWGENAILENDSNLIFNVAYFDESISDSSLVGKSRIFQVKATAPLRIELPLLGYDLQYDLDTYEEKYDPVLRSNVVSIYGSSYYKPKSEFSHRETNRYRRNRMKAYFFSPQHFTRSFYDNKLRENGYLLAYKSSGSIDLFYEEFVIDSCDCITYVKKGAIVTGLKDYDFILRYYKNFSGYPIDINVKSTEGYQWVSARIYFLNDTCLIREDGTRPRNSITFGDGMQDKRIGATLPSDYIPEYY